MYDANLFNQLNLFQFVGGYLKHPDAQKFVRAINRILHHAHTSLYHLRRMNDLKAEAIKQIDQLRPQLKYDELPIAVWSPCINEVIFEMATAFVNMRLLQNDAWRFTRNLYLINNMAPEKIYDAVEQIRQKENSQTKYKWLELVPIDLLQELDAYWVSTGDKLRDFRVLDQHYEVLSTHARFKSVNGNIQLSVLIPDNPEKQSRKQFSFVENLDGLKFAEKAFLELHKLIEKIVFTQTQVCSPLPQNIEIDPSAKLVEGKKRDFMVKLLDRDGSLGYIFQQDENRQISVVKAMSESRLKRETSSTMSQ